MTHNRFTVINIAQINNNNNNNNVSLNGKKAHRKAVDNIRIAVVVFTFTVYLTTLSGTAKGIVANGRS